MGTRGTRRWWRRYPLAIAALVVGIVFLWVIIAAIVYSPEYVRRVLVWQQSDQADYLNNFPLRTLDASPDPVRLATHLDEERVTIPLRQALRVDDLDRFLTDSKTQALIVIEGDRIIYERYFNDAGRESMLTSFSVAKSFVSTLVGIAIDEGFIGSVDDRVTTYLPELGERDVRFSDMTIRDLLHMSSGLEYSANRWALFNGDDPLTTYFPDQRKIAIEQPEIAGEPGAVWSYNKYHPQLLGMILERTTGMSVTEFTQTRLWDPLGMEFDGAWALDDENGFEKMEAGLNGRAVDYAKLGMLFRDDGRWRGEQVVSEEWVGLATGHDPARDRADYYVDDFGHDVFAGGRGYYALMWYGRLRDGQRPDFAAEGDHGQFIYVSPGHDLVIVRNGTSYGIPPHEWMDAFFELAGRLGS